MRRSLTRATPRGPRSLIAARPGSASVLQRDMYTGGRQLEFQAHLRREELDDHAMFILEVQSRAPTCDGNPGARCDVVSREVSKLGQLVDLPCGCVICRAHVDDRNARNGERVRGLL